MKSWLATALIATATGQTKAQAEPEIFGKPGRVLVSGSVSLQNVSSNTARSKAVTTLAVEPAINVFVAPNVALGFQLDIVAVGGGRTLTSVGLLPSVGYNFDLALGVSFVPQARFGFSSTSSSDPAPGSTVTRWSIGGFAPLIVRPKGNFFVGIGPNFLIDLAAAASAGSIAARETVIGIQSMFGGWF